MAKDNLNDNSWEETIRPMTEDDASWEKSIVHPNETAIPRELGRGVPTLPVQEDTGRGEAFLRGAAQGGLMGFADEAVGGGKAVVDVLSDPEKMNKFKELYQQYRDQYRANNEKAQQEHPYAYTAGGLTGTAATMALPGGVIGKAVGAALPAKGLISAGSILGKGVAGATTGAAYGGLSGLGESEGKTVGEDIENTLQGAKLGGMLGGGTAATLGAIGKVAGALKPALTGYSDEFLKKVTENADKFKAAEKKIAASGTSEGSKVYKDVASEVSDLANNIQSEVKALGQKADAMLSSDKTLDSKRFVNIIRDVVDASDSPNEATNIANSIKRAFDKKFGDKAISENELNDFIKNNVNINTFFGAQKTPQQNVYNQISTSLGDVIKSNKPEMYSQIRKAQQSLINQVDDLSGQMSLSGHYTKGFKPTDATVRRSEDLLNPKKFQTRDVLESAAQEPTYAGTNEIIPSSVLPENTPERMSKALDTLKNLEAMSLAKKTADSAKTWKEGAGRLAAGATLGAISGVAGDHNGGFNLPAAGLGIAAGLAAKPTALSMAKNPNSLLTKTIQQTPKVVSQSVAMNQAQSMLAPKRTNFSKLYTASDAELASAANDIQDPDLKAKYQDALQSGDRNRLNKIVFLLAQTPHSGTNNSNQGE